MSQFRHIATLHFASLLRRGCCAAVFLCLLALASCAGDPPIDWEARLNTYSYDDAVAEHGDPYACTENADGGRICSWKIDSSFSYADQMVLKFDASGHLESRHVGKIK